MSHAPRNVTLCGQPLDCPHVCMFTESEEERYRILNPFFTEGIETGEEILTIVDAPSRDEHARQMKAGGVPVDDAVARGQMRILASEDTYGRDGTFAAERMYALLEQVLEEASHGQWGRPRACSTPK